MEQVAVKPELRVRLPLMDGLRGMAALLVMSRHTQQFWPFDLYHGYLAVDVFFLLSGYVIARAYGHRLQSREISAGRFMLVRILRLYPMFLLSALIASGRLLLSSMRHGNFNATSGWTILFMLFMLPFKAPGNILLYPLHGSYWSLLYELIVNFLYSKVVRVFSMRAMLLAIGIAAVVLSAEALRGNGLNVGFTWGVVEICGGMARAVFGIFLGVVLMQRDASTRLSRFARQHRWPALALTLVLLGLPSLGRWDGLTDVLAVLVVFPVCVLGLDAPVENATAARGFMLLGAASYPLYVLHGPLAGITMHVLAQWMPMHSLAIGVMFTAILVTMSIGLERFVDEPARRWLWSLLPKAARRPQVTPTQRTSLPTAEISAQSDPLQSAPQDQRLWPITLKQFDRESARPSGAGE